MGYRIAVVGATGNVGREMLNILAERQFPLDEVAAVASARSTGDIIDFGESGEELKVKNLEHFDFTGWDMALFAAGSDISKVHAPRAAQAGCTVIDNSSLYRMDPDVPLIVPEVNADALEGYRRKNIIANPNCSTAQMVVALKPLHDAAKIKRVVVATYQSSSGKGAKGLVDFEAQITAWAAGMPVPAPTAHRAQLAGNVITLDWTLDPNGFTEEENKVINETKKIMGDATIGVCPTCVRVPVKIAHSEAVTVEFERPISVADAKAALAKAPGIVFMDETKDGKFPQPIHAEGSDHTFVGRVRQDPSNPNALCLWVVADNLRKGAASNAVQCAEELVKRGIVK